MIYLEDLGGGSIALGHTVLWVTLKIVDLFFWSFNINRLNVIKNFGGSLTSFQ